MKLSTTRRLTARRSTRSQKSKSERKGPSLARAARMASTAPSPTFLMAASPKRMWPTSWPGTTVKCIVDWFASGGSTSIPIARHSPMYWTILSVFARSEVSRAAMK